jgi:hypothetical protein
VPVSASADGKALVFLRDSSDTEIFSAEIDKGNEYLTSVQRLHLEQHRQLPFAWTPDSKSVIFISDRDGPFHLFKQAIDKLTPDLIFGYSGVLFLVSRQQRDGSELSRLMEVPFSGGSPRLILEDPGPGIRNFQCARSPSSVCVYSRDEPDRLVFFTFDVATGKRAPLLEIPGGEWHNWSLSPTGSTLAVANWRQVGRDPTIGLLAIRGSAERVLRLPQNFRIASIDFAADGHSIWTVVQDPAGARTTLNVGLHGRVKSMLQSEEKWFGLGEVDHGASWVIPAPDGHRVAFWEASGSSNAWMLQGF